MRRQIKIITACLIGGLFFAGMYAIKAPLPSSVPQEVLQKAGEIHVAVPQSVTKEPKKQDMPEQKEGDIKVVASGKGLVINEGEVGIKSGDKELVVSQEVAEISPALKSFLELGQKSERVLDLSVGVPEDHLEQVVDLMQRYNNLLITTIAGEIPDLTKLLSESGVEQRDAVPLVKAFHFLRVKPLIALLMFTYGKEVEEKDDYGNILNKNMKVAGLPELIQEDIDKMTFAVWELISFGRINRIVTGFNLDLWYNKIDDLNGLQSFQGWQNLRSLNLSHNQLSSLPEGLLQGLGGLFYLDLSHNQLSSLPAEIFQGLLNIKELYFLGNPITTIEPGVLADLPDNLESFDATYKGKEYASIQALREKVLQEQREQRGVVE